MVQVLEECERALFVADREGARVHRFSLVSRAIEGARLPCESPEAACGG